MGAVKEIDIAVIELATAVLGPDHKRVPGLVNKLRGVCQEYIDAREPEPYSEDSTKAVAKE